MSRNRLVNGADMILVTGATGFVGRALIDLLVERGRAVRAAMWRAGAFTAAGASVVTVGDLSAQTDWSATLTGVDAVVHTAARVHVMQEAAADPLLEFRRINVPGTLQLARRAAAEGVRRFVFFSSVSKGCARLPCKPAWRL